MIRHAWPEDGPEISRLAVEQYKRTPWPSDMSFPVARAFLVYNRKGSAVGGHLDACCGYRWDRDQIRVMHVWSDGTFSGKRAAVELMLYMERAADADGLELVFTARAWNVGLRKGVEEHGCKASLGEDSEMVIYRREAKVS